MPAIPLHANALQSERFEIASEDDIIELRQWVRTLAQENGFDSFAVAALTTTASELGRNVWAHAGGGVATVDLIEEQESSRHGIRMSFRDEGPGIPDVEKAMQAGFSTADSLGMGLSGSKRLVDEFEIETEPGKGTLVQVIKWNRTY